MKLSKSGQLLFIKPNDKNSLHENNVQTEVVIVQNITTVFTVSPREGLAGWISNASEKVESDLLLERNVGICIHNHQNILDEDWRRGKYQFFFKHKKFQVLAKTYCWEGGIMKSGLCAPRDLLILLIAIYGIWEMVPNHPRIDKNNQELNAIRSPEEWREAAFGKAHGSPVNES